MSPEPSLAGFVDFPAEFVARYRKLGYWRGKTLGQVFRERALCTPGRLALVDGDQRITYRALDQRADRLAEKLSGLGLTPGQRVLVHLPNVAEFVVLCLALFRMGAIPVLALPAHREQEIVHLAQLSQAVAYVIVDQHLGFDYRELARAVRKRAPSLKHVLVVGEPAEWLGFADLERDGQAGRVTEPDPRQVALLLLSGGTTGAPKLIPRTHEDYECNLRLSVEVTHFNEETRYLVCLPIAHNFAFGCPGAFGALYAGGTAILCRDPSPEQAFTWIEREQVNVTALIPPLVLVWLEAVSWLEPNLSSLRWLQVGGARLKAEAAARVRPVLGCQLQQVYGMAEGLLNFTRQDDPEALVLDTQGRPIAEHDELRIVDPEDVDERDQDVAPGQIGQLLVRGPYTVRGYYQAEEYNRRAFSAEGFYRTGDLVRQLPSGHLVVEGRVKDVINRGGEKVPVEELENHLLAHPAVLDVAVVGVPDETLGERTCACIVPRGTAPSLSELNQHLGRLGVAAFKRIDRLATFEQFPQTRLGKVDKGSLARGVAEQLARPKPRHLAGSDRS